MKNRKVQQIISVFLIIGLLGWLGYSVFFKSEKGMHIIIEADSVAGLEPDNAVTAQGLTIGTVERMQLKQDFSGKIIIDILLTELDIKIPKNEVIAIITDADLMGTKQINLTFTENDCIDCLSNYDTIQSKLGSYFDAEIMELEPLMALVEQTYMTLDTAIKNWKDKTFGNYDGVARQMEREAVTMIKNFTEAKNASEVLINQSKQSYEQILSDGEVVLETFEGETIKEIQDNITKIQNNFTGIDFEKTEQNIEQTISQWNVTYAEVEETSKVLKAIAKRLEKGETNSLAQILNDPRFQSDDEGIINLNYSELLEDIRKHPEKYTYLFYNEKK